MILPLHGNNISFELPSNVVYFRDWRYVNTRGIAGRIEAGCIYFVDFG
jgi:hypothetical protein